MVALYSYDPEFGITGGDENRERRRPTERTRRYTVRLTSDDWASECQFELTDSQRQVLLEIAKGFNEQARYSVDHRVFIQPTAPTGDIA